MSPITPDDSAPHQETHPAMSEQEFLDALKRTPRKWTMHSGYLIRIYACEEIHCPITAVIRQRCFKRVRVIDAQIGGADDLKLDDALVRRILKAADGPLCHEHEEMRLRSRLLEACGIKEREA